MATKLETPFTLAIDIGGTHTKMLILDRRARHVGQRIIKDTPKPALPRVVFKLIAEGAKSLGAFDRVSVGFPGVVRNGLIETAPNLGPAWIGINIQLRLQRLLTRPTKAANDADVQGLGVIKGRGVEMVITLGTGMGVAIFVEGKLVPNVEMWHHPFRKNKSYEDLLGMKGMKRYGEERWNKSLQRAIEKLRETFNYDRLYIGGGHAHKVDFDLPKNVTITSNLAGHWGGVALWN